MVENHTYHYPSPPQDAVQHQERRRREGEVKILVEGSQSQTTDYAGKKPLWATPNKQGKGRKDNNSGEKPGAQA
jgi:hypothetical protein